MWSILTKNKNTFSRYKQSKRYMASHLVMRPAATVTRRWRACFPRTCCYSHRIMPMAVCVRQRRVTWSCGRRPQSLAVGVLAFPEHVAIHRIMPMVVCVRQRRVTRRWRTNFQCCDLAYILNIFQIIIPKPRSFNPIQLDCISYIFDHNSYVFDHIS
jgi:hypothetical protein